MYPQKRSLRFSIAFIAFFCGLVSAMPQAATLSITRAEWSSSDGGQLRVEGLGTSGKTVTIKNVASGAILGTDKVEETQGGAGTSRGLRRCPAASVRSNLVVVSPSATL